MKWYLYLNSKYWFTVYVCNVSKAPSICVYTNQLHIHLKRFGVQKCPSRIVHSKKGGKAVQTDFERKIPNNETPETRDLPL